MKKEVTMKETDKAKLWKFDFYDDFIRSVSRNYYVASLKENGQKTFTLAIIQWILTANGKELKKSAQIKRFRGCTVDFDKVLKTAQEFIDRMNKGNMTGPFKGKIKPFTTVVK